MGIFIPTIFNIASPVMPPVMITANATPKLNTTHTCFRGNGLAPTGQEAEHDAANSCLNVVCTTSRVRN
jgi:hypothetical protein